jgi:hypothetical protein
MPPRSATQLSRSPWHTSAPPQTGRGGLGRCRCLRRSRHPRHVWERRSAAGPLGDGVASAVSSTSTACPLRTSRASSTPPLESILCSVDLGDLPNCDPGRRGHTHLKGLRKCQGRCTRSVLLAEKSMQEQKSHRAHRKTSHNIS